MRLTAKLSLLFLLLSLVPITAVGFLAYNNGRRTIEHQTLNQLKSTNLSKESQFDYWGRDKAVSLEVIAKNPLFSGTVSGWKWLALIRPIRTRPKSIGPLWRIISAVSRGRGSLNCLLCGSMTVWYSLDRGKGGRKIPRGPPLFRAGEGPHLYPERLLFHGASTAGHDRQHAGERPGGPPAGRARRTNGPDPAVPDHGAGAGIKPEPGFLSGE